MELQEFMKFLAKEAPEARKELATMSFPAARIYLNDFTGCEVTQACSISKALDDYKDAIIAKNKLG